MTVTVDHNGSTVTIQMDDSTSCSYEVSPATMRKIAMLIAHEEEECACSLRSSLPITLPF